MKPFQEKVLVLTKKIPRGKLTTYSEIARVLKTGPRAVGRALAANPHPIVIPCHRVVRKDGSLGGYSGGIKKKIALLRREGIRIERGKIKNLSRIMHKL